MNGYQLGLFIDVVIIIMMIRKKAKGSHYVIFLVLCFIANLIGWIYAAFVLYGLSKDSNTNPALPKTDAKYTELRERLNGYGVPTRQELESISRNGYLSEKNKRALEVREAMFDLYNQLKDEKTFFDKLDGVENLIDKYERDFVQKTEEKNPMMTETANTSLEQSSLPFIEADYKVNSVMQQDNSVSYTGKKDEPSIQCAKFCRFCGSELLEGSVFCSHCGEKIN